MPNVRGVLNFNLLGDIFLGSLGECKTENYIGKYIADLKIKGRLMIHFAPPLPLPPAFQSLFRPYTHAVMDEIQNTSVVWLVEDAVLKLAVKISVFKR